MPTILHGLIEHIIWDIEDDAIDIRQRCNCHSPTYKQIDFQITFGLPTLEVVMSLATNPGKVLGN